MAREVIFDWGMYSLKIAAFGYKKRHPFLTGFRIIPWSGELFGEDGIKKVSSLKKFLAKQFEDKKLSAKRIQVILPENLVEVKLFDFPLIKKNELSEAIKWEMSKYLPFSVEDARLSWVCRKINNGWKVVVVAISKRKFELFLDCLPLLPSRVTVAASALYGALNLRKTREEKYGIIDLGAGFIKFLFVEDELPILIRSVKWSGEKEKVEKEFNRCLNHLPAEKMAQRVFLTGGNSRDKNYQTLLQADKGISVLPLEPEVKAFALSDLKERFLLLPCLGLLLGRQNNA